MDNHQLNDIFRLLKLIGGKFIIVEDGKPIAVLMDYQEFQDLAVPVYARKIADQVEELNRKITNAQLQDLREEVIQDDAREIEEIEIEPLA